MCVVDIDKGTGEVKVRRFVTVDDCGNIINPMIVQGQIHGGLTQGLAPALYEEIQYDEDGNNLAGSFMDYLVPSAAEMPSIILDSTETPSTSNPLGVKGVGEAGTIGSAAAVINAICDALKPYGVTDIEMPATPQRIWEAMNSANSEGGAA